MIINSVISWYFRKRIQQVRYGMEHPHEVQYGIWADLIKQGSLTKYGADFGFDGIKSREDFRTNIPVQSYDSIKPYINRIIEGEQQVLWPTEIKWFAKSSGTTSDKSKFIPVSFEALEECQFRGARDLMTIYCHNNPETKIFDGKSLMIGGSQELNALNASSHIGDLSAILMNNLPFWVNLLRTPKPEIATLPNWETKLDSMAKHTRDEDVTSISGVPTWTMLLINKIIEDAGVDSILDIWPNLELYMHGGVGFDPYRASFKKLIPSPNMRYLESYNASEGFFGIQDTLDPTGDMLLMMDYGIYYEFMPMDQLGESEPKTLLLEEVELHTNYALVISTNAGLWRYILGDTICFTSLNPYRFKISGRTKLYINAFGEELMIDNAETALASACQDHNAVVLDYTVAPIYLENKQSGAHQWLIEFEHEPEDIKTFTQTLDTYLQEVNSDYEAKRNGSLALGLPRLIVCEKGTFYNWLKKKGKLGGQHKVPRLSNDRVIVDEILSILA